MINRAASIDEYFLLLYAILNATIIENFGLMGIPMPEAVINAVDILKKKSEQQE